MMMKYSVEIWAEARFHFHFRSHHFKHLYTFSFMDPTDNFLLTELDDFLISRALKEAAELV